MPPSPIDINAPWPEITIAQRVWAETFSSILAGVASRIARFDTSELPMDDILLTAKEFADQAVIRLQQRFNQ